MLWQTFMLCIAPIITPVRTGVGGGGANEFGCRMWVARCYPIPPIFITKIVKLLPECPYLHERLKWT